MRKFGIFCLILFFMPIGLFAKGGGDNSVSSSSFMDEYNNTFYAGPFIDQSVGVVFVEDFLTRYHNSTTAMAEIWSIDSLVEELEDAMMEKLEVYFGDPSLSGLMFLGLMGGLEEGIPVLEDFTYSVPGSDGQKPLDIIDFDVTLKMKAASDYSSLTATMSMSFEYISRDWELEDIHVQLNGGNSVLSIDMVMDFVTEDVTFRVDGSSQNYHVLNTIYGGVKLHTVSVFSEKGRYSENMNFDFSTPLFYTAYTNSGDTAFSGNLILTGGDSFDVNFFDLLSE